MSLSTSCIPCEGGLGGVLDGGRGMSGEPLGESRLGQLGELRIEGRDTGMERREEVFEGEEEVCGGVGRFRIIRWCE